MTFVKAGFLLALISTLSCETRMSDIGIQQKGLMNKTHLNNVSDKLPGRIKARSRRFGELHKLRHTTENVEEMDFVADGQLVELGIVIDDSVALAHARYKSAIELAPIKELAPGIPDEAFFIKPNILEFRFRNAYVYLRGPSEKKCRELAKDIIQLL